MSRLFFLLSTLTIGSCAGAAVIVVLTLGYYTWQAILSAAAIGGAIGVVAAWVVARMVYQEEASHHPEDPEGLLDDNPHGLPRPPR